MKRRVLPLLIAIALAPAGAFAQSTELAPDLIRQIQVDLAARGFSPGPATGQLNAQTVDALQQLQRARSLTPTGRLDVRTLSALGLARAPEGSGTPPASMVGPGSTAPSGRPEGPTPANTLAPGGVPRSLPLGGATPAGAPAPSFGATPAGAPSPSFGATPAGMLPPAFNPAAVGASATAGTTTTTITPPGATTTVTTAPAAAASSSGR